MNYKLLNDCSNTTVNITICIVLNISSDVLFYGMVHFVIIISISKVFQVQNNSQRCLNALAIDNPLEYARLALDGEMQAWVDAEDSLEVF